MEGLITSTLAGLIIILAFIGGEVKSFKIASISLLIYGVLLAIALGLNCPVTGVLAVAVVAVAAPLSLTWVLTKIRIAKEQPSEGVMGKAPFALIVAILTLLVSSNLGVESPEQLSGITLMAYGLSLLASKNNLVKFIIGIVYLHTGVALATEPLYPVGLAVAAIEAAYFTLLLILIWILAYFTVSFYSRSGTIHSRDLTKLRW
jgi:hypothetical protein